MAVLPTENNHSLQSQHQHQHQTSYRHLINNDSNSSSSGGPTMNQSGQYILVQRAGVIGSDNLTAPRASSAPPAQNQVRFKFQPNKNSILFSN